MQFLVCIVSCIFFFQAEDGIRDGHMTGVQTCALPISRAHAARDKMSGEAAVVTESHDVLGTFDLLGDRRVTDLGPLRRGEGWRRGLGDRLERLSLGGVGLLVDVEIGKIPVAHGFHHALAFGALAHHGEGEPVQGNVAVAPLFDENDLAPAAGHLRRLRVEPPGTGGVARAGLFQLARDFPGGFLFVGPRGEDSREEKREDENKLHTHARAPFFRSEHTAAGEYRVRGTSLGRTLRGISQAGGQNGGTMAKRQDHGDAPRRKPAPHDSEETLRRGMATEAVAEDEAETMASTGDSLNSFVEIASGTATGLGIDRGESIGTGGLAAGEDLDEVAEGDYWRQNFRRRPYYESGTPYEHYEPGYRYGWQSAIGEQFSGREFEDAEGELERSWDALHGENARDWEEAREAV